MKGDFKSMSALKIMQSKLFCRIYGLKVIFLLNISNVVFAIFIVILNLEPHEVMILIGTVF